MRIKILLTLILTVLILPALLYAQEEKTFTVTAIVEPQTTDAEMHLTSVPPETTILNEDEEITYTISYKLNTVSGSYPFSIQGLWTKGVIEGTSTAIESLEYVVGSASVADDGTVPVIDIPNKQISWDIPALQPSTGYHTVTFKLKVIPVLPTEDKVTAHIKSDAQLNGQWLREESLVAVMQKKQVVPPSATPTTIQPTGTAPTSIPPAHATVTPVPPTRIPTPVESIFKFTKVDITNINDTSAEVSFSTSSDSSYKVQYGKDKNNLSESITDTNYSAKHAFSLLNLEPDTKYFFTIKAINKKGKVITSDLFTFTTSKTTEDLTVTTGNLMIYSDNVVLSEKTSAIVVPPRSFVNLHLTLPHPETLNKISAEFKRTDVLGITTNDENKTELNFIESSPGVLAARMQVPIVKTKYQLVFTISTNAGSYTSKVAPYIFYVTDPITILNQHTNKPVEGATVRIYKFQESYQTFDAIDEKLHFETETGNNGSLFTILPSGRYRFETDALGYEPNRTEIQLGSKDFEYPTIKLTPHFTVISFIQSLSKSAIYVNKVLPQFSNTYFNSVRALKTTTLTFTTIELFIGVFYITRNRKHIATLTIREWLSQIVGLCIVVVQEIALATTTFLFILGKGVFYGMPLVLLLLMNSFILYKILHKLWQETRGEELN